MKEHTNICTAKEAIDRTPFLRHGCCCSRCPIYAKIGTCSIAVAAFYYCMATRSKKSGEEEGCTKGEAVLWIAPESWGRGGRGRQKGDVRTVKGGAAKKFTLCPRGGPVASCFLL